MWCLGLRLAALAAVAAADSGVKHSSAALRGPLPPPLNNKGGEEQPWTVESDEPEADLAEGPVGKPRRLTVDADSIRGLPYALPVLGVMIWCVLPSLIWNNERMAVKQESYIKKAKDHCVIIDDVNVEPPEILVGHVVFATGITTQEETLVDDIFPLIKAENAVRLHRKVEMYQMTGLDDGGKPRFAWAEKNLDWRVDPTKPPVGGHSLNPPMPIPSSSRLDCVQAPAGSVKMGVFYCGAFVRRDMNNWESLDPNIIAEKLLTCEAFYAKNLQQSVSDNFVYFGEGSVNTTTPKVGDFRVSIEVLNCGPLAVLGVLEKKEGWTFLPLLHEHCKHSHGLCADLTCAQRQNPHWTGRKEDLWTLTTAVEKIETELTDVERSSLNAQLLTKQTEDIDASEVVSGHKQEGFFAGITKYIGHEDFIPLCEKSLGYEEFMSTTASTSVHKVRSNRVKFFGMGMLAVLMILFPLLVILWIPICLPWSYYVCFYPGLIFALLLCCGGLVCSCSFTSLVMAVSLLRFRPLMSIFLFAWLGVAFVSMMRMTGQGAGF